MGGPPRDSLAPASPPASVASAGLCPLAHVTVECTRQLQEAGLGFSNPHFRDEKTKIQSVLRKPKVTGLAGGRAGIPTRRVHSGGQAPSQATGFPPRRSPQKLLTPRHRKDSPEAESTRLSEPRRRLRCSGPSGFPCRARSPGSLLGPGHRPPFPFHAHRSHTRESIF